MANQILIIGDSHTEYLSLAKTKKEIGYNQLNNIHFIWKYAKVGGYLVR